MAKTLTLRDVLALLRKEIDYEGSMRAYAKHAGYSAAYLSDVLAKKRAPGPKILEPLCLEAVTTTRTTTFYRKPAR